MDLQTLQNLCKRDPDAYRDDFVRQAKHFASALDIFALRPANAPSKELRSLVSFMAAVAPVYPQDTQDLSKRLLGLLDTHAGVLDPELRRAVVQALIALRNRGAVSAVELHPHLFRLFRIQDKILRASVASFIVNDIKNINTPGAAAAARKRAKLSGGLIGVQQQSAPKINSALQSFLYGMIADDNESAAKRSLDVLIELWRKGVWRNARTVNVIAAAATSKNERISLAAVKFFLGQDAKEMEIDSDDEEITPADRKVAEDNMRLLKLSQRVAKKTKSRARRKDKAIKKLQAHLSQKNKESGDVTDSDDDKKGGKGAVNWPALQLLNDPQSFAEKLFKFAKSLGRFETRLNYINLVSRLIGLHELIVLSFYPYLQRYMQPHQRHVTSILAYTAQACHSLVPPDALEPTVGTIVNNFVSDRCTPEVITVGLNTVRLICSRCPLAMNGDLLSDLVEYKKHKNKSVVMAARSLIGLFRTVAPHLLHRRDLGKDLAMEIAAAGGLSTLSEPGFGDAHAAVDVEGAHLLETALAAQGKTAVEEDLDAAWAPAPKMSAAERKRRQRDRREGWVNVDHSDSELSSDDEDAVWMTDSDAEVESIHSEDESDGDDDDDDDSGEEEDEEDGEGEEDQDEVMSNAPSQVSNASTAASTITSQRLLTPADFRALDKLKKRAAAHAAAGRKRKRDDDEELDEDLAAALASAGARGTGLEATTRVDPESLVGTSKHVRATYEERVAAIEEARKDKPKFGRRVKATTATSNLEKEKAKPFSLVRYSMKRREKARMSDRQKTRAKAKARKAQGAKRR